ncbi:MAG: tRNA pseudouridine(38-40) synthase TruA [Lachnospiraceae bacterium]|nr:tRNA pseudouridine(38-40) synthase TruA [Lachnospiraceae bacterium]MEE1255949.1 tRNA pseudouridine(38-40) synthase TruA [Lachnospiraceae bacterium]
MKRVMLTVAYDGSAYHGWQLQPNVVTVESVLNEKLSELFGEEIRVIGASRTDTGVHALGNIAVFDTNARMPAEKVSYALNQRLPEDIRIQKSVEVPVDFHPRHQNSRKTYEYKILNREFPQPIQRLYAHFTYVPLDVERMQKAANYFVGEHDYKSFCSVNTVAETTVRTIYSLTVEKQDEMITIRVTGSGFLYNMVRIIAGTLMEVGRRNIEPESIPDILRALDRTKAGPTAPACGLTLVKYQYDDNILPEEKAVTVHK